MTSDLRPYLEYKDSGLPWLGRIPAHWSIERAKWLYQKMARPVREEDEVVTCFRDGTVTLRKRRRELGFTNSLKEIGYQGVREGDLVIHAMDAFAGAVGVSDSDGKCTPVYAICTPKIDIDNRYYAYVVREMARSAWILALARGIRERSTDFRFDTFGAQPVPLPPRDEQKAIADYLDAISAKVRRFIRNRRRLIEVLNEQKQAIINRAVTRGLDPNAPLKPSGIDWLGDIPEHWIVKPLKRWVSINERVLPETTDPEYSFDYLDIGCVGTGRLVGKPSRITFGDAPSRARRIIQRGDTIISTVRTYLRAVWFVAEDVSDLVASTGFAVLSPREGVVPEYLGLTLQSDPFINRVTANSIGIAYPAIAETRLGTFHVAMPPDADEQRAIVKRVQDETATLTTWIERTQREIDLIREYRTRLIADVVTGKVDVRQASAEGVAKQANRHANIHFRRTVFAAEIVHRLHDEPTFGHVKFEKLIFLCEKWCGVETGSTYYRQAAGPYDNRALRSIDSQLKKQRWYEAQKGDKGYRYIRLEKAGEHKKYFDRYFGSVISRFDEIIDLFRHARTEQCEIIATIYAAWEDLLTQGSATDEQIIEQVLHHWHPSKQKISEDRWRKALGWMKEKGLTPRTEATCADN